MSLDAILDFVGKAKAATAKQLRGRSATSIGIRLARDAEGAQAASPRPSADDVYKPRTAWDHADKDKRTTCVRTMGTECQGRHEIWLTLFTKLSADVEVIKARASRLAKWEKRDDLGEEMYVHGPLLLGFDKKNTVTLIYREQRHKPFSRGAYAELLVGLFDEIRSLLAAREESG